jgi:hypothetical protein
MTGNVARNSRFWSGRGFGLTRLIPQEDQA